MNLERHFVNRIRQQAKTRQNATALRHKINGLWKDISWNSFQQQLDQLSLAFLACNIQVQDKIAIFAHNMSRWTIADIAALQVRAITVPIYATNTAQQAEFILNHADVKILFVGDQEQYDQALEIAHQCPQLQKIVAMKEQIQLTETTLSCYWDELIQLGAAEFQAEFETRLANKTMDDLFTIIYTSGTTGEPKGVMLDYNNLAHQLEAHDIALDVNQDEVSLSFLPFSHIFERAWVAYVLHRGAILCYLENTNQVREALMEVRPTFMCAVPRFYEKIYSAVLDKVQKAPFIRQMIFHLAIAVGQKRFDLLIVIFSMIGGLLGFFGFNHKPAKIFMGDVGSLALGGMLAALSIALHQEWTLLLIGIVYVFETASVMLQVTYFKMTGGKRIFRMTPVHHHFELGGFSGRGKAWSEWKVDFLFWGIGLVASLITLAILYL